MTKPSAKSLIKPMVPHDSPPSNIPIDQYLDVVARSSSVPAFNVVDVKADLIGILFSFIDKVEGFLLDDLAVNRSATVASSLTNACFEVNLSKNFYLIDLIFFYI